MENIFYMCWKPDTCTITRKHDSYSDAKQEAERLVGKQGGKIYILQCTSYIENCSVREVKLDNIPF